MNGLTEIRCDGNRKTKQWPQYLAVLSGNCYLIMKKKINNEGE